MGNIFINYRRSGDWSYARLLHGELLKKYDRARIFIDVDSIAPGEDFVRLLNQKVAQSDIFLTVIGPKWLDARDEDDKRRLEDPRDFVRIEIEQALRTGVRVIPLLVDGARMPDARALPESMRELCNRNAIRLSQETFNADAQQLIATIEKALADIAERQLSEADEKPGALTPEQIATAEELANWQFIEKRRREAELRQHLSAYPRGATARMARVVLEEVVWNKIAAAGDIATFDAFLAEFPDGEYAQQALKQRELLNSDSRAKRDDAAKPARQMASVQTVRAPPMPIADNASAAPRWRQPLMVGGIAALLYFLGYFIGLLTEGAPLIEFPLSSTYGYQYNPFLDAAVIVSIALGIGLFAGIGWRMALAAFVSLVVLIFLYDLAFNVIGSVAFSTPANFFSNSPLGQAIWIVFIVGYAAVLIGGLSLFLHEFRALSPWLWVLAASGVAQLISSQLSNNTSLPDAWVLGVVIPPLVTVALASWFIRKERPS